MAPLRSVLLVDDNLTTNFLHELLLGKLGVVALAGGWQSRNAQREGEPFERARSVA